MFHTDEEIEAFLTELAPKIERSGYRNAIRADVIIRQLLAQRDEARDAIAWANNSLYGSHGFFLSTNGGPNNPRHLADQIEKVKEFARADYHALTAAKACIAELEAEAFSLEVDDGSVTLVRKIGERSLSFIFSGDSVVKITSPFSKEALPEKIQISRASTEALLLFFSLKEEK